jgi:hypothetical protein
MDEVGSAITHSVTPNCEMHPLLFSKNNKIDEDMIAFNLVIVKEDIKTEELVTRDIRKKFNDFQEARMRT